VKTFRFTSILDNALFQKQLLFSSDHKKYARDRWLKIEKDLDITKMRIQSRMQNKKTVYVYV